MSSCYDVIIVGAGVAGLRVGIEVLKRHKSLRCCVLEKYNYVGGRVVTYRTEVEGVGEVQWENGAGRISTTHKRVLRLLKKYGLTFHHILGETKFMSKRRGVFPPVMEPDRFYQLLHIYLSPLRRLSHEVLATHTLEELLEKTMGEDKAAEFYVQYPFFAEIHVLRADLALKAFDEEMGTNEGFGVCVEGFQAIPLRMRDEFVALGGEVLMNMAVKGVEKGEGNKGKSMTEVRAVETLCDDQEVERVFLANTVVLATHARAIGQIEGVKFLPVLQKLEMPFLVRQYAVFPKGADGKVWFHDLPKIVTDSRLRYIIPVDKEKGVLMISYTEGQDAQYWIMMQMVTPKKVQKEAMKKIRSLFPERDIPDPVFFKMHDWRSGCTYWTPGAYDVEKESKYSLHPMPTMMPGLFLCGESFSLRQAWVEGALEQADALLGLEAFQKRLGMSSSKA